MAGEYVLILYMLFHTGGGPAMQTFTSFKTCQAALIETYKITSHVKGICVER
jgi:hypothetical protein